MRTLLGALFLILVLTTGCESEPTKHKSNPSSPPPPDETAMNIPEAKG